MGAGGRPGEGLKMPPPPPPGAPPPPAKAAFVPPKAKKGGGGADRGALLNSIQKGVKLKKTVSKDRSSPGGIPRPGGGGGGADQENGGDLPRLQGIGGLFGEGFPQLKSASARGRGGGSSARPPFKVPSSSTQGETNKIFQRTYHHINSKTLKSSQFRPS